MKEEFKVKLINGIDTAVANPVIPYYGIAILASCLKSASHGIEVFDYNERTKAFLKDPDSGIPSRLQYSNKCYFDIKRLHSFLIEGVYDKELDELSAGLVSLTDYSLFNLIGFSVIPKTSLYSSLLIARKIKEIYPDKKIVFGGSWPSYYWEEFFPQSPYVDFIVTGPGEKALLELIDSLKEKISLSEVSSLVYKEADGLKKNGQKLFDIEEESLPDYSVYDLDKYRLSSGKVVLYYRTSSGCVNNCAYCEDVGRLRMKSPEKVFKELKKLQILYGNMYIEFADTMLNYSLSRFKKICALMDSENVYIEYIAYALISNMTDDFLELFKKSGCVCLKYGLESVNPERIKAIGKSHSVEQAEKLFAATAAKGIKTHIYIIVGFPGETLEEVKEIVSFIKKNKVELFSVIVSMFSLKSSTRMFRHPKEYGIENIRQASPEEMSSGAYMYDEAGGISWSRSRKKALKHYRLVDRAVYYHITSKRYRFLVPYFLLESIYKLSKQNSIYSRLIYFIRSFFLKGKNTEIGNWHDQRFEEQQEGG